jgi:hypothetical protein
MLVWRTHEKGVHHACFQGIERPPRICMGKEDKEARLIMLESFGIAAGSDLLSFRSFSAIQRHNLIRHESVIGWRRVSVGRVGDRRPRRKSKQTGVGENSQALSQAQLKICREEISPEHPKS